jgi:hypothetical protein
MEKKPEKVFRIGFVTGSVLFNEVEVDGEKMPLRTVQVQKQFRDGDDWKFTTALSLADLPVAIRVLQLAQQYVESHEAEAFPKDDR